LPRRRQGYRTPTPSRTSETPGAALPHPGAEM